MFKGLGNIAGMLKNMHNMSGKMEEITEKLRKQKVTGTAGGDLVTVEANGIGQIVQTKIDETLKSEPDWEMIQDLLVAATNDAIAKSKQLHVDAMQELTGGMDLPGLSETLGKMGLGN